MTAMAKTRKQSLLHLFNDVARIAKTFGMRLSFDEQDRAVLTLPYNPALDHALDGIHGGIIATMLDNAGWFTSALVHDGDGWMATTEMSFHLLRPAAKTELTARGEILKRGKRQDVVQMSCRDAQGNLVAHGTGTFVLLDKISIEN
ncbi:MAG TPA: PaaI family thioesterase [Myxococcota bacterium]|nr:PaaI family thioesterase [Myxococcota bacterium]